MLSSLCTHVSCSLLLCQISLKLCLECIIHLLSAVCHRLIDIGLEHLCHRIITVAVTVSCDTMQFDDRYHVRHSLALCNCRRQIHIRSIKIESKNVVRDKCFRFQFILPILESQICILFVDECIV